MTTVAKKHRLQDQNAALRTENDQLRADADKLAESIGRGIHDAAELITAGARINELTDQVSALQRAVDDLTAERDQLRAELANRDAVTVPPMQRDTSNGADQATAPWGTDVSDLRDRFETGSPVRLGVSPFADTVPVARIGAA